MIYKFKDYKKPEIIKKHLNLGGVNVNKEGIEVNSLYVEKNGKPSMAIMGEMHFSRVPREQWKTALRLMKEGGIDIVSTYIIWIYHEPEEGKLNWTGDNDLRAFVLMAKEAGLKVCIRIGPWCHGEVRNGGFPDWLINKDLELRTNDEEYLKLVKKWYKAISDEVSGLLFKDGGPIEMCQLDNELTDNAEHLLTLKNIAKEVGIDVPIFTVTGWNSVNGAKIPVDDVIPSFGGYCDAPWDEGTEKLPPCARYYFTGIRNDSAIGKDLIKALEEDSWQLPYDRYPYFTCEIGAGLMNTYHRRYQIHGMDIYAMTLIMLCEGANMLGYYMYHGGLNKVYPDYTLQESKATGYPNDYPIISYDFQAPISSYEETRESYDLLNLLHLFIHDYEDKLATMTYVEADSNVEIGDMKKLRYGVRRDENGGFVFINHYQRLHDARDVSDVVIDTGDVVFPAIDVKGDISFFMPFNMKLNDTAVLKYATAQPLCKDKDTWIFMELPGIKPQFEFVNPDEKCDIRLISLEEAKKLRKVDGRVFYVEEPGKSIEALKNADKSGYTITKLIDAPFVIPEMYKAELLYSNKEISYYKLELEDDRAFINVDLKCDVVQVYVDGALVEDDFYHGLPFRWPRKILNGKEIYLVASESQNYSYFEGDNL
ncbi:beta-galactosidase [Pseudobutyrivibrio ruminis]|uniref:beta-galactosidase n=1 Tax=Pseudobutyrivibrio ruminis TaxID=46206 RepID=UPI000412E914|nr:beta-galactosidase [Pseudobutyrivibrio ruminis]